MNWYLLTIALSLYVTTFAQTQTFVKDIPCPSDCKRNFYNEHSFQYYLQNLPLKQDKIIYDFKKQEVNNSSFHVLAVIDYPLLFTTDIEQCADWCMRFWAEYHKQAGKLKDLYLFEYSGKKKYFQPSELSYTKFLFQSFSYSNSYSIKQGGKKITEEELMPGDMFVQNNGGGIGHVSMILDKCTCNDGKSYYLIGFSYMPAQQFHIEDAKNNFGKEGWFSYEGFIRYLDEYFPYGKPVLRRF